MYISFPYIWRIEMMIKSTSFTNTARRKSKDCSTDSRKYKIDSPRITRLYSRECSVTLRTNSVTSLATTTSNDCTKYARKTRDWCKNYHRPRWPWFRIGSRPARPNVIISSSWGIPWDRRKYKIKIRDCSEQYAGSPPKYLWPEAILHLFRNLIEFVDVIFITYFVNLHTSTIVNIITCPTLLVLYVN